MKALIPVLLSLTAFSQGLQAQRDSIRLDSATYARWSQARLSAVLKAVDSAEAAFHAHYGRYTMVSDSLGLERSVGGTWSAVLWADSTGWRAVAANWGVADGACVVSGGSFEPVTGTDSLPPGIRCTVKDAPTWVPSEAVIDSVAADRSIGRVKHHQEKPNEECPPIQLTPDGLQALRRNPQHLVVDFLIDSTGEPEVRRLRVTGGTEFNGPEGAMETLAKCHFRPARIDSRPVEVLAEMPVNLGSYGRSKQRSDPISLSDTCLDTPAKCPAHAGADRFPFEIREALRTIARGRFEEFLVWLNFARRLDSADLARWSARGIHVLTPVANDSGWSAIAWHDSLPGVVCGVAYGSAPPPLDPQTLSGVLVCHGRGGTDRLFLEDSSDLRRVWLSGELAADARPHVLACGNVALPDAGGAKQEVRLRVVIDTSGQVRPSPIRVDTAATFLLAREALWEIETCRFAPGRVGKSPVATALTIPVVIGDR